MLCPENVDCVLPSHWETSVAAQRSVTVPLPHYQLTSGSHALPGKATMQGGED